MKGETLDDYDWVADIFPLPSDALPTCGKRTDLFKKQRVHDYVYMGRDVRHGGEKGWAIEMDVFACIKCGHDRAHTIKDE